MCGVCVNLLLSVTAVTQISKLNYKLHGGIICLCRCGIFVFVICGVK